MPRRPLPRRTHRRAGSVLGCVALLVATSSCGYLSQRLGFDSPDGESTSGPSTGGDGASGSPEPDQGLRLDGAPRRLAELGRSADLARIDVCQVVDEALVRDVLDLRPQQPTPDPLSTSPGDVVELRVDGGTQAVPVDEYGCSWGGATGPTAEQTPGSRVAGVRVFAPLITPERAEQLARAAEDSPGCSPVDDVPSEGSPGVGDPGVALACGEETLRYEGLVGDAWVVCDLTRADLAGRSGPTAVAPQLTAWCADVLARLDTRAG